MGRQSAEPKEPKGAGIKQVCYVCKQTITGNPVYVGQDTWRHDDCRPGSELWIEVQIHKAEDQQSELLEYYDKPNKEE